MNRKDDHIKEALKQNHLINDFDYMRFVPNSLTQTNVSDVDLSVSLFGHTFNAPIYINAMTGGSDTALHMNKKLAQVAKACGLMIASGSVSSAIKDATWEPSFKILRDVHKEGCILANIGLSQDLEGAKKAVSLLGANALQIHLNAPQEITMPEGDRDFSHWPSTLKTILDHVGVPVIVKDVGFGMSRNTVCKLEQLGIQYIDVAGKGGTNFIDIENARRNLPMRDFSTYGFSTLESLLDIKDHHQSTIFASGGIRGAYDIVKCLYLGATMVGLSGYFLKIVDQYSVSESIEIVNNLILDVKGIMAVLDAKDIHTLRQKEVIYALEIEHFKKQRDIK